MTPAGSDEHRDDFLDDFYAECDELLGNLRTALTQLELAVREQRSDAAALESLYRNTHSFKGIAAIVGLRLAEQLAHGAEDVLRPLSKAGASVSADAVDLLGRVIQRLEHIVTAHRLNKPLPSIDELLQQLSPVAASVTAAPKPERDAPPASKEGPSDPAVAAHPHWQASFTPSPELDQRGVNLNRVRARLLELGRIVSAAPVILAGGKMRFDFVIELAGNAPDIAAWSADGIVLQPVEAPAVPATEDALPSNLNVAPSHIVRVDLTRLDDLMRIVGEMVIHRSRLEERLQRPQLDRAEVQEVNLALGRSLRELRGAITRVRLVPVREIFARLPFVVRDLERETGKKVRVILEGQDTEIDKYLVERLKEPLLHLVRNAISHGIELPADRLRAGKPEEATLRLRASTSGQSAQIEVHDDGRGLDTKAIVARARALGFRLTDTPSESELLQVISQPGFSTREEADRAAGRGVGMAIVHSTMRELSGSVSLETEPGRSTRFTLRLPLTLSIAETFLISAADHLCAVPQGFVEEILTFAEADVRRIQDTEIISYRDGVLPLVRLRQMFAAEKSTAAQRPVLVLGSERGLCGLVVDRVHGQREVVVRAMRDPLIQVPGISGATELGDGRPVLILDPVAIASGAVRPRAASAVVALPLASAGVGS